MGWQRQKHGLAIQQVMEEAGAMLCEGVVPAAVASGRTDAGVHALGQVVQMELPDLPAKRIREALNYHMKPHPVVVLRALNYHMKPHPVVVLRAVPAPANWSARFSAIERTYRYIISNREVWPTIEANRVWHVRQPLDEAAMQRAANLLLGHHDFSSFRASACQAKSPIKTLDELTVTREGTQIIVKARARSFLHHQVRNMVGSLKMVGEGTWPEHRVADVLEARDRAVAGPTAPAEGLYFVSVAYEWDVFGGG
ncbi:MAG: tRNA pseudouridine(38-40) synthase TruA [Acidocella sp. 20-57-95]|nr:MAG: tRNA pseudouridine(38-40) synthase TruA [Acidocella sp. 20-57-95]